MATALVAVVAVVAAVASGVVAVGSVRWGGGRGGWLWVSSWSRLLRLMACWAVVASPVVVLSALSAGGDRDTMPCDCLRPQWRTRE